MGQNLMFRIRALLYIVGFIFHTQPSLCGVGEDKDSLSVVKKLLKTIKDDPQNSSYRQMIQDKVMSEHTLSHHEKNQPYFYSNDRFVITDIIDLVIEEPDGIIDETGTTGFLKVYRESNYHEEIEELFDREKREPSKFQKDYLGQTLTGPTNKVMIILKIKGDEQNEDTLEKRIAYTGNNIRYINAYPVKGTPVKNNPTETKSEEGKAEEGKAEEGKSEEGKSEEDVE